MKMYWLPLNAIVFVIVPGCHKEMHVRLCVYMVLMFPDLMHSSLTGSRRSSSWTESCPMTSWEDKSLTVWPNTSSSVRNLHRCNSLMSRTLCPPCFGIFILTVTVWALFTSPHLNSLAKKWKRDNLFVLFCSRVTLHKPVPPSSLGCVL